MTTTTKLGLKKPDTTDFYSVGDFNDNADIIDGALGTANGIASLDENGRVPYSQLPESAMEFKGTWNASTNTPTLVHGVGTNGDFYVVSVGGTWDGMTFAEGDRILFDGTSTSWIRLAKGVENVNWDSVQNKPLGIANGVATLDSSGKVPSSQLPSSIEALDIKMLGWSVPRECPIQNYMDSNRVFHQRVERVNLGSLNWGKTNVFYNISHITNMKNNSSGYCAFYPVVPYTQSELSVPFIQTRYNGEVYVKNENRYSTDTEFKTAMSGVYLYYELATEKTFNVDGSEIGSDIACLGSAIVRGKWNQLISDDISPASANVTITNRKVHDVSASGTTNLFMQKLKFTQGHKYLFQKPTEYLQYYSNSGTFRLVGEATQVIVTSDVNINTSFLAQALGHFSDFIPAIYDLTEIFGAGNEPTSVEQFRKMFTEEYYPYCPIDGLLWENASPTSSFSAQTLNDIDMSALDHLEVICKVDSSTDVYSTNIVQIDNTTNEIYMAYNSYYYHRSVTANATAKTITFGSGYRSSSSSGTYMIPIKVIGVRK